MSKLKILVVSADLKIGGAQAVAANIAKYAPENYSFCYVVLTPEVGDYENMLLQQGHQVIHIPAPSDGMIKYFKNLLDLMRRERFDVVHCHTMFNCGVVMLAARIAGIPCRISHSHTIKEGCEMTLIRRCYQQVMRLLIHYCGNVYFACGRDAGYVLHGKKWFARKGVVIPNGIDSKAYGYSDENRAIIRRQYHLEDQFVIGHVGHYVAVKNQIFLIRLMEKIREKIPNAVLLLFGEGEDREMLCAQIKQRAAGQYIRLMGNVNNIAQVLSAFDVFAFPSLFEGTPLALIEAQANGLPCIISDKIPADACLTEDINRVQLDDADAWVDAIVRACRRNPEGKTDILLTKYEDIQGSMNKVYSVYEEVVS